ncbi:MAG: hypothetical protein C4289_16665 [Chloroflexota bacterium]
MARRPVEAGQSADTERLEDILQDYERMLVALSEEEALFVGCLAGTLGVSLPAASLRSRCAESACPRPAGSAQTRCP